MFLLVYEFDKGCSLILSTAPVLLIPICANNVAIESRVQYMFPLPARHVIDDWNGEKKLGQPRAQGCLLWHGSHSGNGRSVLFSWGNYALAIIMTTIWTIYAMVQQNIHQALDNV